MATDNWAKRLKLGQAGSEVVREYRPPSLVDGDPPTLRVLVQGDHEAVEAPVIEALQKYSFRKDSERLFWERRQDDKFIVLTVRTVEAGDFVHFLQDGQSVKVRSESVLFTLYVDE